MAIRLYQASVNVTVNGEARKVRMTGMTASALPIWSVRPAVGPELLRLKTDGPPRQPIYYQRPLPDTARIRA